MQLCEWDRDGLSWLMVGAGKKGCGCVAGAWYLRTPGTETEGFWEVKR